MDFWQRFLGALAHVLPVFDSLAQERRRTGAGSPGKRPREAPGPACAQQLQDRISAAFIAAEPVPYRGGAPALTPPLSCLHLRLLSPAGAPSRCLEADTSQIYFSFSETWELLSLAP